MKSKNFIRRDSLRAYALRYAWGRGYGVTHDGRVYSPRKRFIKPMRDKSTGYYYFNVRTPRGLCHVDIHRLQGLIKFGELVFNAALEIRHFDNDKSNNARYNIGIGTHAENCGDTPKHLLWHIDQRAPVACKRGNIINYFPSIYEAAKFTGVNAGSISRVCNGKRRTAGGLCWWFLPKTKPIGTYK